ncbi:hypothetical protein [Pseudaestuariivita sp.]|uniref:hypothetical protein n=1 Tax=Pseudaestuariivita sp. TaxID=2211669 RepID=UPI00405A22EC
MTALDAYQRLEGLGLWRASPEAQRREVVVSLGDATLTIHTTAGAPLTHWSLAAIERVNPGTRPALFHPHGDPDEVLELGPDAGEVIDALEKLRKAVARRRPKRGALRLVLLLAVLVTSATLLWTWLPGALTAHAVKVVPEVKRADIGAALVSRITRISGPACAADTGQRSLDRLTRRLLGPATQTRVRVLPAGIAAATHVPGDTILLGRAVVEDHDTPDVVAGYILAEAQRRTQADPLEALLEHAGPMAAIRLLTTGQLQGKTLDAYAEKLARAPAAPLDTEATLTRFEEAGVPVTPYAFAVDPSGEQTLELIEADPLRAALPAPLLDDTSWLLLQAICER